MDYADLRATAEELIADAGQVAAIRRYTTTGPDYNPTRTPQDYPITVVELFYETREIDGSLVLTTDKKVIASTAGVTITPSNDDELIIAGVAHEVVSVKPLQPGGIVLLWEIQART